MRRILVGLLIIFAAVMSAPGPVEALAQDTTLDTRADAIFNQMSPEQRVGQLFLVTYYGPDTGDSSDIAELVAQYHVGGVVLSTGNENFTDSDTVAAQLSTISTRLQTLASTIAQQPSAGASDATDQPGPYIPLFVGIQQDGISSPLGSVATGLSPLPSSMAVGATWDPSYAEKSGQVVGEEMRGLGINLLLGTSADVVEDLKPSTQGDLGVSVFGGQPFWVSQMVSSYVRGVHEGSANHMAVIVGHFPGHGAADRLATVEVPIVRKSLDQLTQFDLIPFFAITGSAPDALSMTDGVLTGHISYRGFQGDNPRVATRPISLDPQALQVLLKLDQIAKWRTQGGLVVSDALGMRGVKRFYDPQETTFNNRRIAYDALLAGNDLLYTDQFGSNPPENQALTIKDTIAYFVQAYQSDPAFQARVDDAVRRIIRKKLQLYGEFDLNANVLPPASSRNLLGQHGDIAFSVAQNAVTLLSPNKSDLLTAPQANNRIVIFTDTRPVRLCSGCAAHPTIAVDALQTSILKYYGPQGNAQIKLESIQSFSFDQLWNYLQHGPTPAGEGTATPTPDSLEIALSNADWVIFVMQNVDPTVPSSGAVKEFLASPSIAPNAQRVAFAMKAPYYLDSTEIGRLSAYYGVYGTSTPFIDVAARSLFLGLPLNGASPVSVSGTNYSILDATSPDPNQLIKVTFDNGEGNGTATSTTPDVLKPGQSLQVSTGIILDQNSRPVPDGTPVDFLQSYSEGLATSTTVNTVAGIASTLISPAPNRTGQVVITVQSGDAKNSQRVTITTRGEVTVSSPDVSATATDSIGATPSPTGPTPTPTPNPNPNPPPPVNFGDWFTSLFGLTGLCLSVFWYGFKSRDMNHGLLLSLPMLVFGLSGYNYYALHLPGIGMWYTLFNSWSAGFATWLTSLVGLGLTLIVLGGRIPLPRRFMRRRRP